MTRALLETHLELLLLFTYALARLSGLMLAAPFFSSPAAPMRVRALLAVGLAALIAPLHQTSSVERPGALLDWSVAMGGEALLGLALGLGVLILFSGLQFAGHIIGQMSGMQLADAFDPTFDGSVPIFSQMLHQVALAVFLVIGGHRLVLGALLDTFEQIPPGSARAAGATTDTLVLITTLSMNLGIRAAAPAMMALLISVLVLGLISRTLPQLNVMAVGFGLNAILTLAVLAISFGAIVWIIQDHVEPVMTELRESAVESANGAEAAAS
jgi:flagellar biosynthetic protein FliR